MKSTTLSAMILALLFATAAFGQTDTVFTTQHQEFGTLAPQQFISEYDRAFGMMTPANWMAKADFANAFNNKLLNTGVGAELEGKVRSNLSLHAGYRYSPDHQNGLIPSPDHRFSLGFRWYYNMRQRMAAGKSAANFSGNYVGMESAVLTGRLGPDQPKGVVYDFLARFGIQRRLFRDGYFDLSYSIGAKFAPYQPSIDRTWSVFTQPRLALGFARFGPRNVSSDYGSACDVLKCFQEHRRMFKIDLYNLLQVSEGGKKVRNFSTAPSIAYEQKIGSSPFSMEFVLSGNAGFAYYKGYQLTYFKGHWMGGEGLIEGRWYFLQRKRILKGQAGNNLSGIFAGLHNAYGRSLTRIETNSIISASKGTSNVNTVRAVVGMQHRILNHGFVQVKIGAGSARQQFETVYDNGDTTNEKRTPALDLFTEIKAGLAF